MTTTAVRRRTAIRASWTGGWAVAAVTGLVVVAVAVPAVTGWTVHALGTAPTTLRWRPRVGWGTPLALAVALVAVRPRYDRSWTGVLGGTAAVALAWSLALALVDGRSGLAVPLARPDEYLDTARRVGDVGAFLHGFTDRIAATSAAPWPTHVAGHPPGATLVFVLLDRVGLGGDLAAALVVVLLAATTPVAVLVTLRALGAEGAARRVAPVLAAGPWAVWTAVSADALFAAVAAWALAALAVATGHEGHRPSRVTATAAGGVGGALLAVGAYLSYGLVLMAVLAAGVAAAGRGLRAVPAAALGAAAVVGAATVAGFRWWDALPVLHERYYAGLASQRPASYWVWADVAALAVAAGPALGPALGAALRRARVVVRRAGSGRQVRVLVVLTLSAALTVALADASLMSKSEVERIWLPFLPWLLVGTALLPAAPRRRLLVAQVVLGLVLQTLFLDRW